VLCVCSSVWEVPFICKGGRWSAGGGHIPGAVGSLGAAGPVMCRLSPWTLLITTLEADIGWLLRLASPGKLVDWCGRPTSVLCDAPTELGDT
jgi:hypothetical protein